MELLQFLLLLVLKPHCTVLLVGLAIREGMLHDDGRDEVHQHKNRDGDEHDEEEDNPDLHLHEVPDQRRPRVQGHHLEEAKHGQEHVAKVLLRRDVVPEGLLLAYQRRRHDREEVQDAADHDVGPEEGLHALVEALQQRPHVLELGPEAHGCSQADEAQGPKHCELAEDVNVDLRRREDPGCQHAQRDEEDVQVVLRLEQHRPAVGHDAQQELEQEGRREEVLEDGVHDQLEVLRLPLLGLPAYDDAVGDDEESHGPLKGGG
mmetsp:Transcript_43524/g.135411  ORF Transcript_43524/g.135411 Transcript_43524/m.135411 type:complete len:262 (-) Transcript_43524:212-997(-)